MATWHLETLTISRTLLRVKQRANVQEGEILNESVSTRYLKSHSTGECCIFLAEDIGKWTTIEGVLAQGHDPHQ